MLPWLHKLHLDLIFWGFFDCSTGSFLQQFVCPCLVVPYQSPLSFAWGL